MKDKQKEISVLDVFTEQMMKDAKECKDVTEILERVIEPNMEHINTVTNQENDSRYWAYAMQFTLTQLRIQEKFQ